MLSLARAVYQPGDITSTTHFYREVVTDNTYPLVARYYSNKSRVRLYVVCEYIKGSSVVPDALCLNKIIRLAYL